MRKRERERFMNKLKYTEEELVIRDQLKGNQHNSKYKIIITEERDPNHLSYYCDNPWDGYYIDMIYFNNPCELEKIIRLYEGELYQMFIVGNGKMIGYGLLDPDSPFEEIQEIEPTECKGVCEFCWWRVSDNTDTYKCEQEKLRSN